MVLDDDAIDCERISRKECRFAAEKLGYSFEIADTTSLPSGCVIEDAVDVYFNENSDSTDDCDNYEICVCKKP